MPTKIAFLADCLYGEAGGGTERQILKLCQTLPTVELDIHVFFLKHLDIHDTINWNNAPYTLNIKSLARLSTIKKTLALIKILDEKNIKIVQTFFDSSAFIGAFIKIFRPDIKVIGSLRNCGHAHSKFRRLWLGWSLRRHDHIVVNASIIKNYMRNNLSITDNTSVIYNVLDSSCKHTLSSDEVSFYENLKSNFQHILIVVANLKPLKGIDDLMQAIQLIDNPGIAFCFIGGGNLVDPYREKLTTLNINSQCFILGSKNNVLAHLNESDVAIQPSHSEGLSNSLIEYLFSNLPIIATDVGGSSEILEYGKLGKLIPARDPAALKDAILKTLENITNEKEQAKNNNIIATKKYSAKEIALQYKRCYLAQLEKP